MNNNYNDLIEQISCLLFKSIVEREENLTEKVPILDKDLFSLLRAMATNLRRDTLSENESSWRGGLFRGSMPRTKAINSTISPLFFRSLFLLQKLPLTNCPSES